MSSAAKVPRIMGELVWVRLFIIGAEKSGCVFGVDDAQNGTVGDLKRAVYQAMHHSLGHCNADDLRVCRHGHEYPPSMGFELEPSRPVPPFTSCSSPLRVVAPKDRNLGRQQANKVCILLFGC